MTAMDLSQYTVFITTNLPYILLGLTVLIFVALIVFININMKMSRLNRRYQRMMAGMDGVNIERLLVHHVEEVRQAVDKVNRLEGECRRLDTITAASIQYVGVVRFNAFEDTGSDLSFALALLDGKKNGVVLSSIYGRNESRVYAKPVVKGESTYYLTDEEKGALDKAVGKSS
ncbi:DUF4446 family protein [Sporomusa sp.]|jgi:hypothetical protein|uniref:DUF4446 family protein n=1 Tax=Sporomusa sp. TaxID=2078658 RepID=UPI002B713FFF|nr:DUF4446 family protein [Sporomusa sp.]HWR06281.1 DUF4446 family protein [Sporomusa sp.]